MIAFAIVAVIAALLGVCAGYALSKQAVEWCPTCGRNLAGHCPESRISAAVCPNG